MSIVEETNVYPRGTTYSYYVYEVSDGVTGEWAGQPTLIGIQEGISAGWYDTCRWVYQQGTTHENYNFPIADHLGELIE